MKNAPQGRGFFYEMQGIIRQLRKNIYFSTFYF
jgi:hypothetical protein